MFRAEQPPRGIVLQRDRIVVVQGQQRHRDMLDLNFFADRIDSQLPILLAAGALAVLFAWGTIAGHALRIARANPVLALRYE